jgi:glycosyltransferase involved in cell wall biosynthesis
VRLKSGKHVLVVSGGGDGPVAGGVGRLIAYLRDHWAADPNAIPTLVLDSRGDGGALSAARHFSNAAAALLRERLAGRAVCAHLHMTTRGSAARKSLLCALCRLLGLPVVLHLHGADFFEFAAALPWPLATLLRAALASARIIIVIGTDWQARLTQDFRIPASRIRVVPNGVPAAPRAQPVWPPHILFLGRLGARKGVGELISALASPAMANRSWTATIAGDGDGAAYHEQIEACFLRARIRTPGWQTPAQTQALLAGATILVLPSHHEVMPLAVLEAMARGIAIVATPVGCLPDILLDGVNASLVPPGDPVRLSAALAHLIDSPRERTRLGDAALQLFQERLSIDAAAAQIQAIYRQAACARHRRLRPHISVAGPAT